MCFPEKMHMCSRDKGVRLITHPGNLSHKFIVKVGVLLPAVVLDIFYQV